MTHHHLSPTEHYQIQAWLEQGLNKCQIAGRLGRHRSTIYRERRVAKAPTTPNAPSAIARTAPCAVPPMPRATARQSGAACARRW
ncbi:helix-turn-helix domain-containing protein [Polaromonas sp.]|uniref:helix-turn-helix domain-containing protein n=1 Tax=Polaromonas sp. TaxID=1869339 RepID=UPI003BAA4D73